MTSSSRQILIHATGILLGELIRHKQDAEFERYVNELEHSIRQYKQTFFQQLPVIVDPENDDEL